MAKGIMLCFRHLDNFLDQTKEEDLWWLLLTKALRHISSINRLLVLLEASQEWEAHRALTINLHKINTVLLLQEAGMMDLDKETVENVVITTKEASATEGHREAMAETTMTTIDP